MPVGIQELIALLIVIVIVGFALYRRWRKKKEAAAGCADCSGEAQNPQDEAPIRLYRRRD